MTQYGPWIFHDGDKCPVAPDTKVQLLTQITDGTYRETAFVWAEEVSWKPVFAYRVLRKAESEPYAVVIDCDGQPYEMLKGSDGPNWHSEARESAKDVKGFVRFYTTDGTLESTEWPE